MDDYSIDAYSIGTDSRSHQTNKDPETQMMRTSGRLASMFRAGGNDDSPLKTAEEL